MGFFSKPYFQYLACLISVTTLGRKNNLLCALGKYCLFRHTLISLEEMQRLGKQGNRGAGVCPFKVYTMPVFCDIKCHRKAGHLIEINVAPAATRIHLLLSYMRMGSCHTELNKLGCYFEKILPDSLLGFVLRGDIWH